MIPPNGVTGVDVEAAFWQARTGMIPREAFFNPENMRRVMGAET
jgi:hypothetical protein